MLTGKALLVTSVLCGIVSLGYTIRFVVPQNYISGIALLVSNPASALHPASANERFGMANKRSEAELMSSIDRSIPHLTVTTRRMTQRETNEYDASLATEANVAKK